MAGGSKAYVCSSLIAEIAGLNPAVGIDFRLMCLSCVVYAGAPATADRPYRGVLSCIVCVVCVGVRGCVCCDVCMCVVCVLCVSV